MKFLMDQNSERVENVGRNTTIGNDKQAAKNSLSESHGQLILMPEVSNLITSVNQLMSHNFELLKMARVPGNDIGMCQRVS